ncbi:MAG: thiamine-binding protein [Actinomycetota bacterium]|nr:thiamine-binding protein [Actinomycetota bacterium]
MDVVAAFSISPLGGGAVGMDGSVSEAVAEAIRVVRESGLPNETNAMFTNVEGEWDEVMAVIAAAVGRVAGVAPRVSVVVKLDVRPGHAGALRSKVERVEEILAGPAPDGRGAAEDQ